jgi:hypothetical protein
LEPDPALLLPGLLLGGAENDLGAGQDPQVVVGPSGRPQPAPDVLGEGQRVVEVVAVRGEDDVGVARGEVASLAGVARLEDHGMALGAARQGRREVDVELRSLVPDLAYGCGCRPGGGAR